jgi:6-phosphogluconate dehydrogenase
VEGRVMSARRPDRIEASSCLTGPTPERVADVRALVDDVQSALYAAKCVSYAQGFDLIRTASSLREWSIDLSELARIWKGGCIIRARLLGTIQAAYADTTTLAHLLLDDGFASALAERQRAWRSVVCLANTAGIAVPALSASLAYYDSLRSFWLPANLIQAQRDYFGAHTYERNDKAGTFHTEWKR